MYVVSREYHDHMQSARRHVLARATIDYTDPLIDQGIQATANDRARISGRNRQLTAHSCAIPVDRA